MHNSTIDVTGDASEDHLVEPGVYRVIFDLPTRNVTIAALIHRNRVEPVDLAADPLQAPKRDKKKAPLPLVGRLCFLDRRELERLQDAHLLRGVSIAREAKINFLTLCDRAKKQYEVRCAVAEVFLDLERLQGHLIASQSISVLVQAAAAAVGVSRGHAYKVWTLLCRHGFSIVSLYPRYDRSGAPGVRRPCDPGGYKKAGRKTTKQRNALRQGIVLEPEQPGMSTDWTVLTIAADRQIPAPKPKWPLLCNKVLEKAFFNKFIEDAGELKPVEPELGSYPNDAQIKRALCVAKPRLQLIQEQTTKRHFNSSQRGLTGHDWEGVAGPNHTWMIDSTVGDTYLRSSIDRRWIIGRPVVYVVVDVWSTAVVAFYVCLEGPKWDTMKVALFNACFDPLVVAGFWGSSEGLGLSPNPTLPFGLQGDRGELLSIAARLLALKALLLTSYAPPYRGDLKGLVEVLFRIKKDQMFRFDPGAFDARREELEFKRADPNKAVFTIRQYAQALYETFLIYNLTADRTARIDPHMRGAGVVPTPAGLWNWGHWAGIGCLRSTDLSDLITGLLPLGDGRIRGDGVWFGGNKFMSDEVKKDQWTALAKHAGGTDIPVRYYPGSLSKIWTPRLQGTGMHELQLSDQSRAPGCMGIYDWADSEELRRGATPYYIHLRKKAALGPSLRRQALLSVAQAETRAALAEGAGAVPTISEARAMEAAMGQEPLPRKVDELKADDQAVDPTQDDHDRMMRALLQRRNAQEGGHE